MDMQQVLRDLQDTATVMAGIQARQAAVLKGHGEWLEQHERMMARVESNLMEATEKLNGLIVIVDDLVRHRKNGESR
jgi:hypothetical protein